MGFDVIIAGGGLGGASLADQLARSGAKVLVLERETKFRDRVRGENMLPWGAGAARRLGILDDLMNAGGHRPRGFTTYAMGQMTSERDLPSTSPDGEASLNMYHPDLQEALIARAAASGAVVRRGTTVVGVEASGGRQPVVTFEYDGLRATEGAGIVVGADGRASQVRNWAGFEVKRNPDFLTIAGTLVDNTDVPDGSVHFGFGPGFANFIAPLGGRRARMYFIYPGVAGRRGLSGNARISDFFAACRATLLPSSWYDGAESIGPLAEFDGADRWVPSPAKNGVVLIGDAAASTDPCWGCGLSLTMVDVEHLSSALKETEDWDAAIARYAAQHDEYYGALRRILGWMTELFWSPGPEANERRGRVFPRMLAEPHLFPDAAGCGPFGLSDEAAGRRLLGLD